ncbi:MAG: response regulator [Crocinitomicaceae bacterium]
MFTFLYITSSKDSFIQLDTLLKQAGFECNFNHFKNDKELSNKDVIKEVDLIFCDQHFNDQNALDFLNRNELGDEIPVVVLAEDTTVSLARKTFKAGAFDYLNIHELSVPLIKEVLKSARHAKTEMQLRKNLEKRLDSIYANTRAILDNTTDGIWSLDKDGKVLIINSVAKDNIKEHGDTCPNVGESFFDAINPIFSNVWEPLFHKSLVGEHLVSVDKYTDGDYSFFLEVACSPIYSGKDVFGITFIARNVTERELAESKIRESEKNFRSVFTGSDVPIMLEAQSDNSIVDLNKACAQLHGYERIEMIGMNIFDTIPPDYIEQSQKNLQLYLKGEIDPLDSFVYTKNKEIIPVEISVAQIVYNDTPCNLIFLYDISQRKETEKKLKEARELAEKSAEFKSLFLANMSHEIRTPMNAMIGFTDLLKKTNLSEEQDEYIDIISNSGQDLLVIINDILDLSKIEAGKLKLRPRKFSLAEAVGRVIQLHKNNAKQKSIELLLQFDSEAPTEVCLDDTRLSQILNNLVSNAIKFTQEGQVIVKINTKETDGNELLQIIIEDSGIGIPQEELESIFENFNQVDSSLQRKYAGTGLGLSIVSQLIELMDGRISVSSEVGKGSRFEILLPEAEVIEAEHVSEVNRRKEIASAELKVLICEDNPVNVKLATKILLDLGVHYRVANNGKTGLEAVKSFDPDIVLMDLQMPVMDGYETTLEIRKFSEIPIIAMSAHVLEEEQKKCEEHGMNGFIPKPFKEGEIIDQISKYFKISGQKSKPEKDAGWTELNLPGLANLAKGDRVFALSILDLFIETAKKEAKLFKTALNAKNLDEQVRIAHKLLPTFLLLDMAQLHIIAQKIEEDKATNEDRLFFLKRLTQQIEEIQKKRSSFKP